MRARLYIEVDTSFHPNGGGYWDIHVRDAENSITLFRIGGTDSSTDLLFESPLSDIAQSAANGIRQRIGV